MSSTFSSPIRHQRHHSSVTPARRTPGVGEPGAFTSPTGATPASGMGQVPAFHRYRGRQTDAGSAGHQSASAHQAIGIGPSPHTLKAQRERSETQRSVLSGMSWKFLTETTLEERGDWHPPTVLTKEGMEYVQKIERERRQQQQLSPPHGPSGRASASGVTEDGTMTPPTGAPLRTLMSDLVSPTLPHSAYYSPPVAPTSVQEKLGLFAFSPSNTGAAARAQARANSSTPSASRPRISQFHADTPLKRAQANAATNARRDLLEKFHPIDPTLVRHNSRKELPPLPPKLEASDLNITTETQQREEGTMEAQREEQHDLQRAYDRLEQSIIDMAVTSIKHSQDVELPAPHPVLDRSARKPTKKAKGGGGGVRRGRTVASSKTGNVSGGGGQSSARLRQVEEKEERGPGSQEDDEDASSSDGGGGSSDRSSDDPELDDDASMQRARVERAREYHARLLGQLTDPFADEKRSRRGLSPPTHGGAGVSPHHRTRSSFEHTASGVATAAQIIVWRDSSRLKPATDVPSSIAEVLLHEPTMDDRVKFVQKLNLEAARQRQELAEDVDRREKDEQERAREARRHEQERVSRLRIAISEGVESDSDVAALASPGLRSLDIPSTEDQRPSLDLLSPSHGRTFSMLYTTAPGLNAPTSPLSPSSSQHRSSMSLTGGDFAPLSLTALASLPEPQHFLATLDEDSHANPFQQQLPPRQVHELQATTHQAISASAAQYFESEDTFAQLHESASASSLSTTGRSAPLSSQRQGGTGRSLLRPHPATPQLSSIILAPSTPALNGIAYAPLTLDPAVYEHVERAERFALDQAEVEAKTQAIETQPVAFEYTSTNDARDAARREEKRRKAIEERSEAILNGSVAVQRGGVLASPAPVNMNQRALAAKGLPGFQFSAELRAESVAAGGPDSHQLAIHPARAAVEFALAAGTTTMPTPAKPEQYTLASTDFSSLALEARQSEAAKWRKREAARQRKLASSPSKFHPQPAFKPCQSKPLPFSHLTNSSVTAPTRVLPEKKSLGAWYLPPSRWKAEAIVKTNEEARELEERHERELALTDGGKDALPKALAEKQQALLETIPTLFISSVYKGHLEKLAKDQREKKEKAEREDERAKEGAIGGGARSHTTTTTTATMKNSQQSRVAISITSPSGSSHTSGFDPPAAASSHPPPPSFSSSSSSRPHPTPSDPLSSTPVRVPSYLARLIPLDPHDPDTVIVDFAPGTNFVGTSHQHQQQTTTGGGTSGGTRSASAYERGQEVESRRSKWAQGSLARPSKGANGITRSQTPQSQLHSMRPLSPPNPNVQAHRAAEAAREAQALASTIGGGGGAGADRALKSPARSSKSAGALGFVTPTKSPVGGVGASSPSTTHSHAKSHHRSLHSISQMIVTHQSTAGVVRVATAEEVEAEALLARHPPEKFAHSARSTTHRDGTQHSRRASPSHSPGRSERRPSASTLGLPGTPATTTMTMGSGSGVRRRSIQADPAQQAHLLKGIGIRAPKANGHAHGRGGSAHPSPAVKTSSSVAFRSPASDALAGGLASSHHAHPFLPNILVGAAAAAAYAISGPGQEAVDAVGAAQRERLASLNMRAYIMAQAQAEADAVRAHALAIRGEVEVERAYEPDEPEFQHPIEVGSKRDPIAVIQVHQYLAAATGGPAAGKRHSSRMGDGEGGPAGGAVGTETLQMERLVDGEDPTIHTATTEHDEDEEAPNPTAGGDAAGPGGAVGLSVDVAADDEAAAAFIPSKPRMRVLVSDDGELIHNPSTLVAFDTDDVLALADDRDRRYDPSNSVISPLVSPTARVDMIAVRRRWSQEATLKQVEQ